MSHFPFDASRTINGIITVVPPASAAGAIIVSGSGTNGGSSYVDFIKITNTSAGALTPSKTLRLDNSGSLQLINNAYNQNLLSITDAGNTLIYGGSSATTANNVTTFTSTIITNYTGTPAPTPTNMVFNYSPPLTVGATLFDGV